MMSFENWWDEVEGECIIESVKNIVMQGFIGNIFEDMLYEMDNEINSFDQFWDFVFESELFFRKNIEKFLFFFIDVLKEFLREMFLFFNIGNVSNKYDVFSKL